ncbi:ATP-binding protein [Actinoplanes sp. N902-109]|uniref:ATP-binding protein n=1 Tax=Actinoplanes sp. (strain N902-109) TaxID=649831 RepID=UPI0003294023|nr:ATP-binding protein [Actinoplanes sp. N902-109]AGL17658.1 ATP-binding protein [Actinoplanes sp. N902-109]
MRKCLSEHPATLVLDLRGLRDPHAESVTTWMSCRHQADALTPRVQVVVCAAEHSPVARRLGRTGVASSAPVLPSLAQARAAAAEWLPLTGRFQVHLEPELVSSRVARGVVTDACTAWRMPELCDRGRLVISELVANAVEHAGTPVTMLLSRRGCGLHLAVRDGDPRLPQLCDLARRPGEPLTVRGRGLHTVHAVATLWGSMPSGSGKVVWATVRPWRRTR